MPETFFNSSKLLNNPCSYRNEHGLFKNLEELKNVSGIGQKTYEALLEYITIE